jgi:hypothetical protein
MSLKITNTEGFTIGGVLNPSVTEIFVRPNVDMNKQQAITDENEVITSVQISTNAKVTLAGGLFDDGLNVAGISPIYWLTYSTGVTDMNEQYLEIETDLKTILEGVFPSATIEIVSIPVV